MNRFSTQTNQFQFLGLVCLFRARPSILVCLLPNSTINKSLFVHRLQILAVVTADTQISTSILSLDNYQPKYIRRHTFQACSEKLIPTTDHKRFHVPFSRYYCSNRLRHILEHDYLGPYGEFCV
jgi:hypothetical protein